MRTAARVAIAFAITTLTGVLIVPNAAQAAPSGPAPAPTGPSILASWFSGTVAAGASLNQSWNNANPLNAAYVVGFSPAGASTSAACQFEVTRSWYLQRFSGEREFWFTIKNVGSIACGANILLGSITTATTWPTGGMNPGASQTTHWNNANPLNASYVVGLSPKGATNSSTCQFEVTKTWYVQQPGGEREFYLTVKNVGAIACTADVWLASKTTATSWPTDTLAPGISETSHWNNANPLTVAYLVGLTPSQGQLSGTPCQFQVTRTWYLQRINTNGSVEREFYITVKNVGALTCSATVRLASVNT